MVGWAVRVAVLLSGALDPQDVEVGRFPGQRVSREMTEFADTLEVRPGARRVVPKWSPGSGAIDVDGGVSAGLGVMAS